MDKSQILSSVAGARALIMKTFYQVSRGVFWVERCPNHY